jgi:hypothetical protein
MRIGDLDIDIPTSWEDHSLYSFVAPPADVSPSMSVKQAVFRTNVVMQRRPVADDTPLERCVEAAMAATARDFGQVKIELSDGPTVAGGPSKRLVYKVIDSVTNQPVAQVVYVCLVRATEWTLAFSTPALSLKESLPDLDAIVASIRRV